GLVRLGGDRARAVCPGLALALVRPGHPSGPVLGNRGPADRHPGPVLRARLPRSRRPLALSLALLRCDRAGGPARPGRPGAGPGCPPAPGRSLSPAPDRFDPVVPRPVQHVDPGVRRRAAVPPGFSALGAVDRPWVRGRLGLAGWSTS